MVVFPNAKINLGLHVTGKRIDGFHDIETIFFPIPWEDALEAVPAAETNLIIHGLTIDGDVSNNLILQAYRLLSEKYPMPSLAFHLLKKIPFGAGLGGGSADAAFAIRLINEVAGLGLTQQEMHSLAAQLGSDCAFFIHNTPALGLGRGDVLTPVQVNLSGYHLVVLFPGIPVSTPWAYRQITPAPAPRPLTEVIREPIDTWQLWLTNDFEPPVFREHPVLEMYKQQLYDLDAVYASMSGSGSTLFGLFERSLDRLEVAEWFRLPVDQVFCSSL